MKRATCPSQLAAQLRIIRCLAITLVALGGIAVRTVQAQATTLPDSTPGLAVRIDGPPAPVPPQVMVRDHRGRVTVRAVRLTGVMNLDGRLDESIFQHVPSIAGFIQSLPDEGAPASEPTDVWILYDNSNVYVAARCWDSAPEGEWIANEMRRDTNQLRQNDTFDVAFDTYYDRRNAVMFYTNPLGAIGDYAISNEGNVNSDWNPVWDVRTGRFDGGWTVEMRIPFKSLRYRPGSAQVWGVQMRRAIRHKNEWTHLTLVPRSVVGTGSSGVFRVSAYATLVGLEAPAGGRNVQVKPFGISGVTTDRNATPPRSRDVTGEFGVDLKYGVTQNLTADFTYNTDFAQVEVDEQQVNLTRFTLFFPEKRDFFLEGRGIFDFARGGAGGGGGGGGAEGGGGGGLAPTLFFSRRIGIEGGRPVPILGGGRLTGKLGAFDVGAVTIHTDDDAQSGARRTNFTALRVRRDILRRSAIGGLFTGRSRSTVADGSSQTYGVDATFAFYDNVSIVGYYARTQTPGLSGNDRSYQGRFVYDADEWGVEVDHLLVGDNFNPEVGFLRRDNFRRSFVSGRISPRPESIEAVRQFTFQGSLDYIETADLGALETRERQALFRAEFENSDVLNVTMSDSYERLDRPFRIASGVTIPAGAYGFRDVQVGYSFGLQRPVSGSLSVQRGSFYDGELTALNMGRGRIEVTRRLSLEPSVSFNWVKVPAGAFRTRLLVSRVNYTFTPRMFLSGLVQYNSSSHLFSTNVRLRWEYRPGSELFVVYTEDRDTTLAARVSPLLNRALVVKFNMLLRL